MSEEHPAVTDTPELSLQHYQARLTEQLPTDPVAPHTCEHCSNLVLVFGDPPEEEEEDELEYYYSFHARITGLTQQSAQAGRDSGCPLYHNPELPSRANIAMGEVPLPSYREKHSNEYVYNGLMLGEGPAERQAEQNYSYFQDSGTPQPGFEFVTWTSHHLPATEASFAQAKLWLQQCLENHEGCTPPNQSFVPTRLVKIPTSDEAAYIHVVETKGKYRPWCALSYCWGEPQIMQNLSKASWTANSRTIPLSLLPTTILDAILVARRLGIPYIWIDALCIKQDDVQDMNRELATMPPIYKNSLLTISAATAATSAEGFLRPRPLFGAYTFGYPIRLRSRYKDGNEGYVILQRVDRVNEPIHSRAWTLQEHILSPRILSYNTAFLEWSCRSLTQPDCAHRSAYTISRLDSVVASHWSLKELFSSNGGQEKEEKKGAMHIWEIIVQKYSRRSLSFPDDKLNALSAMAQELGNKTKWQYAAGMWKDTAANMICWILVPSGKRPKKYRAPSWSWASLDGEVGSLLHLDTENELQGTIEDVYLSPASETLPYGSVREGSLTVRSVSLAVTYSTQENVFRELQNVNNSTIFWDAPQDDFGSGDQDCELHLLPITIPDRVGFDCLILKPVSDEPMQYQRVGLLSCTDDEEDSPGYLRGLAKLNKPRLYVIV